MTPPPDQPHLIELVGAGKTYGGSMFRRNTVPALQPLDLVLRADRPPVIAVVGESGSGKTTTLGADEVLVMHRGHVVEHGNAISVIGNPQHDYTRLLVASIPWPDLDRRWGDGESAAERQTAREATL